MVSQLERDMTAGIQPYVVHKGDKFAQTKETLDLLGLISGQEVSTSLLWQIFRKNIEINNKKKAELCVQIALRDAKNGKTNATNR